MTNSYLNFDGTDQYVTVADNAALNFGTGDFSISFWIKTSDLSFNVFTKMDTGVGYKLYSTGDGYINFFAYNDASNIWETRTPSNAIITNEWVHIVIIKNAIISFYVDSQSKLCEEIIKIGNPSFTSTTPLEFSTISRLNGSLDDIRIYKSALTSAEVNEIYNSGFGKKYTALSTGKVASAAFQFNEGMGNYTIDSVSGLLGTLVGNVANNMWVPGGVPFAITSSIEQSIFYTLSSNTDLTAAISSRIYPSIIPQDGALPCITYQQISGIRDQELASASGFVTAKFQINCWSKTYGGSRQLADLVRAAMAGQTGTIQGKYIYDIQLEDENDMPQVDPESEIISRYGKRLDFQVFFNE